MTKMLEEIAQGGRAIRNTLLSCGAAARDAAGIILDSDYAIITGSGTSFNAGLSLQVSLLRSDIPAVMVRAPDISSHMPVRYGKKVCQVVISQSGESSDAIEAMRMARKAGARIVGITNEEKSTLAMESDVPVVAAAGHEEAIAATKSYVAELAAIGIIQGRIMNFDATGELSAIADWVDRTSSVHWDLKETAGSIGEKIVFLGGGYMNGSAMEGALKFRETGNLTTDAFPPREYLHGPIQTLDSGTTVFLLEGNGDDSGIAERISSHTSRIVRIGVSEKATFKLPEVRDELMPIACAIPMQILACYKSLSLGLDPDRPDKLTKVVR